MYRVNEIDQIWECRQIADPMESNSDRDGLIVTYCKLAIDAMGTFGAGGTPEEFDGFIAAQTTK